MKFNFLLILGLCHQLFASCPSLELGQIHFLKETNTSMITPLIYDLDVLDQNQNKIGKIDSKIFKLKSTMVLSNLEGETIVTARAKYLSWGTHISFYDCKNQLIGKVIENSVKRRVITGGSSQTFDMKGSQEELLSSISKIDTKALRGVPIINDAFQAIGLFKSSNFQMESNQNDRGMVLDAKAERKFFDGWKDDWKVSFSNHTSDLKKVMFLFLPAYRTRMDSVLNPESSQDLNKKRKLYESIYQD